MPHAERVEGHYTNNNGQRRFRKVPVADGARELGVPPKVVKGNWFGSYLGATASAEKQVVKHARCGIRHFAPTFNIWQTFYERYYAPESDSIHLGDGGGAPFSPLWPAHTEVLRYYGEFKHHIWHRDEPPLVPAHGFVPTATTGGDSSAAHNWGRIVGAHFLIGSMGDELYGFDPMALGAAFRASVARNDPDEGSWSAASASSSSAAFLEADWDFHFRLERESRSRPVGTHSQPDAPAAYMMDSFVDPKAQNIDPSFVLPWSQGTGLIPQIFIEIF